MSLQAGQEKTTSTRMARFRQVMVTLKDEAQKRALKAQARAWADDVEQKTGVHLSQPVSAYVRWLIEQDGKRRKAK